MYKFLDDASPIFGLDLIKGPAYGMAGCMLHACDHTPASLTLTTPFHSLKDHGIDGNRCQVLTLDKGVALVAEDHTAIIAQLADPHKPWKGSQDWKVAPGAFTVDDITDFKEKANALANTDAAFMGVSDFLYPHAVWPAWQTISSLHPKHFRPMGLLAQATMAVLGTPHKPYTITGSPFYEANPRIRIHHLDLESTAALEIVLNSHYPEHKRYAQQARTYTQFGKRKVKIAGDMIAHIPTNTLTAHHQMDLMATAKAILDAHHTSA